MSVRSRCLITSLLLVVIPLFQFFTPVIASNARVLQISNPTPNNIILFYDDYPTRGDANYKVTPTIAQPLVTHVDQNGKSTDWMFDSFIFYSAWLYYQKNTTQQYIDSWTSYLFDGMQVANLDASVGDAKAALNQPSYQMMVFLTIPVAVENVTVPSILNNINSLINRWNNLGPKNLKLVGFYWGFTEDVYSVPNLQNIIPQVASYVHSLSLKMLFIPYQWPGEYAQLYSLGFDYVTLQPNYAFTSSDNLTLFTLTNDAMIAGYVNGVELELSLYVTCCGGNWLTNLQTYMQQANQYQWYTRDPTSYYHGSDISAMARSPNSSYRAAYDAIYSYIMSTRTAALSPPTSTNSTSATTTSATTTSATTTSATTTSATQSAPLPLNSLATEVLNASAGSVSFILPDYTGPNHSRAAKCGGVNAAQLSDYSAGGYVLGLLSNPQNQLLDNNPSISMSTCGNPTGISGAIVTLAGPGVNTVVHYYEQVAGITPVYYLWDGSRNNFVVRATGVKYTVPNAGGNTVSGDDLFLIEAFTDAQGRHVFVLYGFSWQGTLAAGVFYSSYMYPQLSQFPNAWYIYRWTDASSGSSMNMFPDPGDAYTLIATSGSAPSLSPSSVPPSGTAYSGFAGIGKDVFGVSQGSVYFIQPDYTGPYHTSSAKCGGRNAAQLSDYSAGGYILSADNNSQNEVLDTGGSVSSASGSCGQFLGGTSTTIVTVAGPGVNTAVYYYEQISATTPVYYLWDGARNNFVVRATGTRYTVSAGNAVAGDDLFLLEQFTDSQGRHVYVIYGFSWQGTLAGATFLNTYVRTHLSQFTNNWYIYEWKDASSGASANSFPDQGDTFTQLAAGN